MIEATNIKTIEEMIDSLESEKFRIPTQETSQPLHVKPILPQESTLPTSSQNFQKLIEKLYDRNAELGECFEHSIRFMNFEDNLLVLSSSAQGDASKILKNSSSIIKHFVQEIFGLETKIEIQKSLQPAVEAIEAPFNQEGSNTESCVAGDILADKDEFNVEEIQNHPFIVKAEELFKPRSSIKIYPKVV